LLDKNESEHLLGALLQHTFQGELDEKSYTEITDTPLDKSGKTRLFVGFGKSSGLTRTKLIDVVKKHCNISTDKIYDIQIRDKFAFISLPFREAEQILEYFQKNRNQSGIYITKAKKDQGPGNNLGQRRSSRQGKYQKQEKQGKRRHFKK